LRIPRAIALTTRTTGGNVTNRHPQNRTLDVSEGGRLVIGDFTGTLFVRAGRPDAIEIEVDGGPPLLPPAVEVERDGNDVYLETHGTGWLQLLRPVARPLRLDVSVPARFSVEVTTSGGSVEICGVRGDVEVRGRAGHLLLSDVRGAIDGRTSSGSIDVSGCRGEFDLATSRGSIAIRDVEGRVAAHTRGGPISIVDTVGDLLLGSGGGPIQVEGVRAAA
jgi:hypothetical protein